MLTRVEHEAIHTQVALAFRDRQGFLGFYGGLQSYCLPACLYALPLVRQYLPTDPPVEVAIGRFASRPELLSTDGSEIAAFVKSKGTVRPPKYHAWMYAGSKVIADYVGPKHLGYHPWVSWFDQRCVDEGEVCYHPVLTGPSAIANFMFALMNSRRQGNLDWAED